MLRVLTPEEELASRRERYKQYKRILVILGLSDQDRHLMHSAAKIARLVNAKKVYCLYVAGRSGIPASVRMEFPALLGGWEEFARQHIEKLVQEHFADCAGIKIVRQVAHGRPLNDLLKRIRRHHIDLIIVGKPSNSNIAEKLIRTAPCSVLVMPTANLVNITRILVPVDFSERSAEAMKVALAFASAAAVPEIICMHVFRVPNAYYKLGKSHALLAALERKK
jgi:nucleotide-binding universal stress UspA family protein